MEMQVLRANQIMISPFRRVEEDMEISLENLRKFVANHGASVDIVDGTGKTPSDCEFRILEYES